MSRRFAAKRQVRNRGSFWLMPTYRNPDFTRLPGALAKIFEPAAQASFFALPSWYDLMARHCTAPAAEIRICSDEHPGCEAALVLHAAEDGAGRRLVSLANAYSIEHGVLHPPGSDLGAALARILDQILGEAPRWDGIALSELDPRQPGFRATVAAMRRAGLLVECAFHSGAWYEDTEGMSFSDYVAARPSELRNTLRRKRRRLAANARLKTVFFCGSAGIDQAIAQYQAIYAQSWKPAEGSPGFIPALIRLAAEKGALRLGISILDGVPAAAQLWIVWNRRAIIYKLAHDKRFDEFSLGTLLTMEMTEWVLSEDRPCEINFGRGDDPYKKLWLPKRRERWGITAANPRTPRGLGFGLKREAAKLYHRLRGEALTPSV
jgi:CelD/BcsL family acetyltransferase involved in cellulose biosynthesis